jgi:hypothetical protein
LRKGIDLSLVKNIKKKAFLVQNTKKGMYLGSKKNMVIKKNTKTKQKINMKMNTCMSTKSNTRRVPKLKVKAT